MSKDKQWISYAENELGQTACGARIMIAKDTPFIHYRDEVVYFCGQDCAQLYDDDPLNSCMAARLLSGN
jgi:hypothetical protein